MPSTFIVLKRRNTKGKQYYQVRFKDESGNTIKSKSYPEAKTKLQAMRLAEADLHHGIIPSSSDPLALQYCSEFWSENSPYFKSRKLKGKALSESYRYTGVYGLKHFEEFLRDKRMSEISPIELDAFADKLAETGLKGRSINLGLAAIKRPMAVFCKKKGIPDPLLSVESHEETPKERGVITVDELSRVVSYNDDYRAKAIFLLGALGGLRRGEVRGLHVDDIDFEKGIIHVRHNFVNTKEGLKAPKCDSIRSVPVPSILIETLKTVVSLYPTGIYAVPNLVDSEKPCDVVTINRAFTRILKFLGITEDERKNRNLVYHGLRHTFVTLAQSTGLPDFIVARLSGHKTLDMVRRYTNAEGYVDFADTKARMEKAVSQGKEA
ncbi:tyrosine-type recombinase/integrase [Treponema zuelzerae]|uniref:Tyrosine-type recombinase/integrase n=1 Tax=Teretinema zuelzerae TaxID=156 RepID=A0AAE3EHP4_9SPIR|nr:site-specific integrase [Teretinema zuelzerae]MCD1655205.1 tyrosine-type recombinase/integrase [Teretinema zuelzerae]